ERHSPWLTKRDHAHGNQRSKAKLSHSAQARMSTLYTHIGNEITVAAGSGPVLRSANQLRELLHEPFPTTCMSGVPRRPDGTVTTMVASAATDSAARNSCNASNRHHDRFAGNRSRAPITSSHSATRASAAQENVLKPSPSKSQ